MTLPILELFPIRYLSPDWDLTSVTVTPNCSCKGANKLLEAALTAGAPAAASRIWLSSRSSLLSLG